MRKNPLKRILKRRITLMAIPHTREAHIVQVRIPVFAAVLAVAVFLGVLGYSIYVTNLNINYEIAQGSVRILKDKAFVLVQEVNRLREKEQKLAGLENRLRDLVGYKNKRALVEGKGIGGPAVSEQNALEDLLKDRISKEDIKNEYEKFMAEVDLREQSSKEVFKYVLGLRSVWAATPKGRPLKGFIASRYGIRNTVFGFAGDSNGKPVKDFHYGLDIANRIGTKIQATADGKVVFTGKMGGYGNLVIVEHGYGYTTRYGHCSTILVKKWQAVKAGDFLAEIGVTGNTTGPHVHYELRRYGQAIDPKTIEPEYYSPNYSLK